MASCILKKSIPIIVLLVSNFIIGQEAYVGSEILHFQCDKNVDPNRFNTRITKDSITEKARFVQFSTTANCCVNFKLESKFVHNSIQMKLIEDGEECDCSCGYSFEVKIDGSFSKSVKFYLNNELLKNNIPKLAFYEKRYFIFESDTTGFDDENGLRQGAVVYKKKNRLQKVYYKNGKFIKFEIMDLNGKIMVSETDEDKILDY